MLAAHWTTRLLLAGLAVAVLASPALAEEGGGKVDLGNLGQAVASLLIFVMLLVILGKYAWKPIIAQLRRREESIATAIERSEKREAESRELLEHYKAKLDSVETDAKVILAQARQEAAEMREAALASAHQEARHIVQTAREEVEFAKRSALRDLRQTTADMTLQLTEKVLDRSLGAQDQARLVEQSLEDIARHDQGKL